MNKYNIFSLAQALLTHLADIFKDLCPEQDVTIRKYVITYA